MAVIPGKRVCGRGPKLPIGTVSNRHFKDAMYRDDSAATQAQIALEKLRGPEKRIAESTHKESLI